MIAMKNGINKVAKKLKKQATYPNEIFQKNPYILFVTLFYKLLARIQDDKKKKTKSKQAKKQENMHTYKLGRAYIPCLEVVDENFKDPTG
jgi:hypothetical protein